MKLIKEFDFGKILISIFSIMLMYAPLIFASSQLSTYKNFKSAFLTPEVIILLLIILGFLFFPKRVSHLFRTYRWKSFDMLLGSLGFGIAGLFLIKGNVRLDFNLILIMCEYSCFALGFGNGINAYFDYVYGVDTLDYSGDEKRLVKGEITTNSILIETGLAFILSIVLLGRIIQLNSTQPIIVIALCLALLLLSYAYTAPPFKLKYRYMGELTVGLASLITILIPSYILTGQTLHPHYFLFGVIIAFQRSLPNYLFNVRDYSGDKLAKIKTLPILIGISGIRLSFQMIVFVFVLSSIALGWLIGPWIYISLATVPLGVIAVRKGNSLSIEDIYTKSLIVNYIQYHFLVLMLVCYIQIAANLF